MGTLPPGVTGAVTFAKTNNDYWAPTGYSPDGNANEAYKAFRTFLAFDFAGRDKG